MTTIANDYNDAVVSSIQPDVAHTPASGVVETTTGTPDSDVVATDVPVDDTLPTGDAPEPAPGVPGTTDPGGTDPGGDVPGDDDSGRGDDPGDTSTPTTPSDPSTPSQTPPPPPPTTTPPPPDADDGDEDEDEEEECTGGSAVGSERPGTCPVIRGSTGADRCPSRHGALLGPTHAFGYVLEHTDAGERR